MVGERNRVIELKEYLSSLGICVNIGKNKARGHKGIFMHRLDFSRIDVSDDVEPEKVLSVMLHEFAHYIHYSYDKTLLSLDFVFDNFTDEIREELIKITVNEVPKDFAENLYRKKDDLAKELKMLLLKMKTLNPDFKSSEKNKKIENKIKYPFKYLLKYDRINFMSQIYSVQEAEKYNLGEVNLLYLQIKSKQRAIKRINSKISRLNKYYNNPTELFARFLDAYYTNPEYTFFTAPAACLYIKKSNIPYILKLNNIFS